MNQIAIGDALAGWLVLSGESVAPPFKQAAMSPVLSPEPIVDDALSLSLEGTPEELSNGLAALEKVKQRAVLYSQGGYPAPPCLRCQPFSGGEFFFAPLTDLNFAFNPAGYDTHQTGSLLVTLHIKRSNHFDSSQVELPLTNRNGAKVTGGIALINYTDSHAGHDSSVLIDPEDFDSTLPAPLRLELENTYASGVLQDIFVGLYHHPSNDADDSFFLQSTDFIGGSLLYAASAINDYYCHLSWPAPDWTCLGGWTLDNDQVNLLAGRVYRPVLHFFNAHAYDDLLLKLKLQRGASILYEGDAVYSDLAYQYLLFPPIRIPPHRILWEDLPHHIDLMLYGQHESAGSYQIDIDQVHLLPLDASATFLGFYPMEQDDVLVDDSFRGLHNVQYSAVGSETVAHLRQGGPLILHPEEYNRLFFVLANGANQVWPMRTAKLRAYYRKRVRIL